MTIEKLKSTGLYGTVGIHTHPTVIQDEVYFDDWDLTFTTDNGKEIIINDLISVIYGNLPAIVVTPKKGWLVFIEDMENGDKLKAFILK